MIDVNETADEQIAQDAHELADTVVNFGGYADDPDESDQRSKRRDSLEIRLRATVEAWSRDDDLANEFAENGLDEAAEYLREHGVEATVTWIDSVAMPEAIEEDRLWHHGEGFILHNLQVARDHLEFALRS